jgi:hypothetical protein
MRFWEFRRVAKVSSLYAEFRGKGMKHSAAVTEVVAAFKRSMPEMPISESGVRRILSKYRPRGGGIILSFERASLNEEDIKRYGWMRALADAPVEKIGIPLAELPVHGEKYPREKVLLHFSERPNYPRINRKAPSDQTPLLDCRN